MLLQICYNIGTVKQTTEKKAKSLGGIDYGNSNSGSSARYGTRTPLHQGVLLIQEVDEDGEKETLQMGQTGTVRVCSL
jgi:hypothetical protein